VRHLEYSYSNRGAAYAGKKHYDEAIADYNKALELSPEDPGALVGRAIAHANKERHDQGAPQAGVSSKPGAAPSPPAVAGAVDSPSSTAPASAGGEKVSRPLSMRKEPGKIAAPEGGKGTFSVQFGAFSNEHNAVRLAGQLKEKGYDAFVVEGFVTGKGTLHRVLIGRFKDRREAVRAAAGIKSKENVAPLIYAE
jgi:cell division septation protein DedD